MSFKYNWRKRWLKLSIKDVFGDIMESLLENGYLNGKRFQICNEILETLSLLLLLTKVEMSNIVKHISVSNRIARRSSSSSQIS